jgi:ADP-ribose pyrophosphatase YjhB (NUDIX family)
MPTLGVNVAVCQDRQILLIKRGDFPVWGLPGGHVDDGESMARAAIRETREETGLHVELVRLVGIYSRPDWRYGGDHSILFTAKPISGRLQAATDETVDARYFDVEGLPDDLLWYHYQRIIDALSGAAGVVWTQDAVWPLDEVTNTSGIRQLVLRGEATLQYLRAQFCGRGRPGKERIEVQEMPKSTVANWPRAGGRR